MAILARPVRLVGGRAFGRLLRDWGRAPVTLLTGFLGSGKTTLLRAALATRLGPETAVVVNEVGEIALDHHLLANVREDVVVLGSGCICCSMRDDLVRALCDLVVGRERGTLPPFERVVIETTGLADPAPLVRTLVVNGLVASHFVLAETVTTVDAVLGPSTLDAHPEALRQVLFADRLILTKSDCAAPDTIQAVGDRLLSLQPSARLVHSSLAEPAALASSESAMWSSSAESMGEHVSGDLPHRQVRTASVVLRSPLSRARVLAWQRVMADLHGHEIVRIKGIVRTLEDEAAQVLQSAQKVVYPLVAFGGSWPATESKLVLISVGMEAGLWSECVASARQLAA